MSFTPWSYTVDAEQHGIELSRFCGLSFQSSDQVLLHGMADWDTVRTYVQYMYNTLSAGYAINYSPK
jgi:hypothetical protein